MNKMREIDEIEQMLEYYKLGDLRIKMNCTFTGEVIVPDALKLAIYKPNYASLHIPFFNMENTNRKSLVKLMGHDVRNTIQEILPSLQYCVQVI